MAKTPGVIDLGDVRRRADERDAATKAIQEEAERKASQERFAVWDKAMRRAFKGIMPSPQRHAALQRAVDRQPQDD
jgi:hypothetical protein